MINDVIIMPTIGSDYWYLQASLTRDVYVPQRTEWHNTTLDKFRYVNNYFKTEREAQDMADKYNEKISRMIPSPEPPIIHETGRRKWRQTR